MRRQTVLIASAGVVAGLLALIALFVLGTHLPSILPRPAAVATPSERTPPRPPARTPTPTPSTAATGKAVGPVAPGVHPWDALLGGECLDPFTTPWAQSFTVVDCAGAHPAQLVYRGTFDATSTPEFPGPDALQQQLSLLCAAPGVIDLAAARSYTDAQVQATYPVTAEQWADGDHDYYCFVSRSSGQDMTGSVAGPNAAG